MSHIGIGLGSEVWICPHCCILNSNIMDVYWTRSYTRLLICAEDLSKVISASVVFLLPLVCLWSFGSPSISKQLVAGSIIVRHINLILEPSFLLRVYGPMRSTHNASQGVIMTSFGGTCPYFWLCLLFTWQDLQDLTYDRMVRCIPFQYSTDFIVLSRREYPGCWR